MKTIVVARLRAIVALLCLIVCAPTLLAQFEPESAQVLFSFAQFADGGPRSGQWQTSFLFVNPSTASSVVVQLSTYNDAGGPLPMDLGDGSKPTRTFTIPPSGSRLFRSTASGSSTVIGWAIASSSLPVQATVLFTLIVNGTPTLQASAPGTLPTLEYWSPANRNLGIALANIYSNISVTVNVTAFDSAGNRVGGTSVTLPPLGHTSFNLYQRVSGLSDSFTGSIRIDPQRLFDEFVAWTLNADPGVISSLPSGNVRWPIPHYERIWLVYLKLLDAAHQLASGIGTDLTSPAPVLNISSDSIINAFASPNGTVQINLALSELISDSPSELAFAVAHELGHIVQYRTNRLVFNSNAEFDADEYGMLFSLLAGYDPYAAAGTLAKLSMASGQAGLVAQVFDNISGDLHGSFNNRLAAVYNTITTLCQLPQAASFCAQYKQIVHPHFPVGVPLSEPRPNR